MEMVVGVSGRVHRIQPHAAHLQWHAVLDADIGAVQAVERGNRDPAAHFLPEPRRRREVVGMDVRVDRHHESQPEVVDDLQVALPGGKHRVHQDRLAGLLAGQQVGVGRRNRFEQLAEDHGVAPPGARRT